jgi:hypothetical protein
MDIKRRIERLERGAATAAGTAFFWQDGDDLTPGQKREVEAAAARGADVKIFTWTDKDNPPPDMKAASDAELRDMISRAVAPRGKNEP